MLAVMEKNLLCETRKRKTFNAFLKFMQFVCSVPYVKQ